MSQRTAVLFGSYDAALHPRIGVLRDGLASHGWSVSEVNAPLGASTADKVAAAGSGAAALRLVGRQGRAWRRLVTRARSTAPPDVVVVGYLGHADVHLARALFRGRPIVLDHLVGLADTMRDRRLGGRASVGLLEAVDRAALRAADLVVVDTALQAQQLRGAARERAVVVPVGAGSPWLETGAGRPARDPDDPLRVIFFGLFTPLQGAGTIGAAIRALRGHDMLFTLVGRGQDWPAVREAVGDDDRVRWLDWVDPADLPGLVGDHDVCLGVFGAGPKAQRVVPTKVYQGMAAGCAVVTGDTPAVAGLGLLTVPPGDAPALADALLLLAEDPGTLAAAQRSASATARRFTPAAVTAELADRMAALAEPAAPLPPLTMNAWLRWDVIARALAERPVRDILEIGPGEGAAACRLAEGRRYTGIEPSERTRSLTADRLRQRGADARLLADLDDLPADDRFDAVCAFEVIEHIEDDRAALAGWVARLRPGGTLVLSTPADPARMGPHDVLAGHYRRYRAEDLADIARSAGLVDVRVRHIGFPVGYALEAVRNRLATRRLAGAEPPDDAAGRTEASSSILQPPRWSAPLMRMASAPFRRAQRLRPDRGTGLVLVARAPG